MQTLEHSHTDSALLSAGKAAQNGSAPQALPSTGRDRFPIGSGRLFINGQWRDATGGKTYPVYDPATEEETARIAEAAPEDAEAAIQAATVAFESWSRLSGQQRGAYLLRVADLIEAHGEALAYLQAKEMGRLYSDSMSVDIPDLAAQFRYFAGAATMIEGHVHQNVTHMLSYSRKEPLGVVAAITPFNFPLILSISKLAPALAAGVTLIWKPAPTVPLSAIKFTEILQEAGLPDGTVNLLTESGAVVGPILTSHPGVKGVVLTGSTNTGKAIIKSSADTLKHLMMELGGKSANVVFADADLGAAAQTAYWGMFYNKGEICYAASRMLIERSVYEDVIARIAKLAQGTRVGDPLDPKTQMGPIANKREYDNVLRYMDVGRQGGARLVTGGGPADAGGGKGYFVQPTVFADVTTDMTIWKEETFGPILSITPFEGYDEAIRLANGNQYGLVSGVHTTDMKKALRASNDLQAGVVWVNTWGQFDVSAAFGGYKMSGYNRERGQEALDNYLQVKTVWINME